MSLLSGFLSGAGGADAFYSAQDARKLARDKFDYMKEQDAIRNEDAVVRNQLLAENNRIKSDQLEFDERQYDEGKAFRNAQLEGQLILNATNTNTLGDSQIEQALKAGDRALPRLRAYAKGDGAQSFEYDYGRILDDNPALTAELLSLNPNVTFYRDGRGNKRQLTAPLVQLQPNGRYAVSVLNDNGERVPLTQNATDADNDLVVTFDRQQLLGLMETTVDTYTGNAAARERYGDYEAVFKSRLRLAASEAVVNSPMGQADQGVNRSVQAIIFDQNTSTQDLEEIARDNGVDVDLLRRESQVSEQQGEERLVDPSGYRGRDVVSGRRMGGLYLPAEASQTQVRLLKSFDSQIAELEAKAETVTGPKLDRIQNQLVDLDQRRREFIQTENKKSLDAVDREISKLEKQKDKASDKRKGFWQGKLDEATSKKTELEIAMGLRADPSASTRLDPNLFRGRLVEELNARRVTQQEVSQVQQMLAQKNVTDPRQLATLPDEEAYQAIFVMAALEPDPTKRSAIIEEMTNLVTTGDPSMTRNQQEQNDINAAKYMQSRDRYFLDVGIELNKQSETRQKAVNDAWQRAGTVLMGIVDDTGRYQEPTREALVTAVQLFGEYADQTGVTKEALKKPAMDVLYNFIAAKAAKAAPGTFEFQRQIDNWKNPDGELRLGKGAAAKLIRLSPDGQTLFFKDPTGGNANWRIPVSRFRESVSAELLAPVLTVARANTNATSGP